MTVRKIIKKNRFASCKFETDMGNEYQLRFVLKE